MPTVTVATDQTHHRAQELVSTIAASLGNALAIKSGKDKEKIERLRTFHSTYVEMEPHWRFLLKAYEGGPQYVGRDTLFKHQRETAADFDDRLQRAHYSNFSAPLVDFVPEYIFSEPIERSTNDALRPLFEKFLVNVDRAGSDMSTFMREVAEYTRLFGKAFVLLDKPRVPDALQGRSLSELDAESLGLNSPYLVIVPILEVVDWRVDTFGNYTYIRRLQKDYGQETYTEWWPDKVVITTIVDDEIASETPAANTYGVVPFVPVFNKRSKAKRDQGVAFLQDIAYQNRHVFNLTSLIDEFLHRQCFNVLAMESDTAIPAQSQVEGSMGTSNVLEVPKGASRFPEYISPPVDPAKFIQQERAYAIEEMYRQAAQDVASELFSVSNRSGDAAKQAFGRTVPVIARLADQLQDAETRIMTLWARMIGKTWNGKIAYKDDYGSDNVLDLLINLTTIFQSVKVLSPTFVREQWKRVVTEFDSRIPHDVKETIYTEIDSLTDDEILEIVRGSQQVTAPGQPTSAQLQQGHMQEQAGSDKAIAAATGSRAASKEQIPDRNVRKRR